MAPSLFLFVDDHDDNGQSMMMMMMMTTMTTMMMMMMIMMMIDDNDDGDYDNIWMVHFSICAYTYSNWVHLLLLTLVGNDHRFTVKFLSGSKALKTSKSFSFNYQQEASWINSLEEAHHFAWTRFRAADPGNKSVSVFSWHAEFHVWGRGLKTQVNESTCFSWFEY